MRPLSSSKKSIDAFFISSSCGLTRSAKRVVSNLKNTDLISVTILSPHSLLCIASPNSVSICSKVITGSTGLAASPRKGIILKYGNGSCFSAKVPWTFGSSATDARARAAKMPVYRAAVARFRALKEAAASR